MAITFKNLSGGSVKLYKHDLWLQRYGQQYDCITYTVINTNPNQMTQAELDEIFDRDMNNNNIKPLGGYVKVDDTTRAAVAFYRQGRVHYEGYSSSVTKLTKTMETITEIN